MSHILRSHASYVHLHVTSKLPFLFSEVSLSFALNPLNTRTHDLQRIALC